jgi:hypothetical protein
MIELQQTDSDRLCERSSAHSMEELTQGGRLTQHGRLPPVHSDWAVVFQRLERLQRSLLALSNTRQNPSKEGSLNLCDIPTPPPRVLV